MADAKAAPRDTKVDPMVTEPPSYTDATSATSSSTPYGDGNVFTDLPRPTMNYSAARREPYQPRKKGWSYGFFDCLRDPVSSTFTPKIAPISFPKLLVPVFKLLITYEQLPKPCSAPVSPTPKPATVSTPPTLPLQCSPLLASATVWLPLLSPGLNSSLASFSVVISVTASRSITHFLSEPWRLIPRPLGRELDSLVASSRMTPHR